MALGLCKYPQHTYRPEVPTLSDKHRHSTDRPKRDVMLSNPKHHKRRQSCHRIDKHYARADPETTHKSPLELKDPVYYRAFVSPTNSR